MILDFLLAVSPLLPVLAFVWASCPCCAATPNHACGQYILPYGFDVIVPSVDCGDSPSCGCGDLTGTTKVFRGDYVNRQEAGSGKTCVWANTGDRCNYYSIDPTVIVAGVIHDGTANPCDSTEPRTLYGKIWDEYLPATDDCAHHTSGGSAQGITYKMLLNIAGFGTQRLRLFISTYQRIGGTTVAVGWNAAYQSAVLSPGSNLVEMGLIELTFTGGSAGAPDTVNVLANSLDLPPQ